MVTFAISCSTFEPTIGGCVPLVSENPMLPRSRFSRTLCLVAAWLCAWSASVRADEGRLAGEDVASLLGDFDGEALLVLVLPEVVEQTGRLTFEMPRLAESLLPPAADSANAEIVNCVTRWAADGEVEHVSAIWHRAGRGETSRFVISHGGLSKISSGALLLMGREINDDRGAPPEFYCRVIRPEEGHERCRLCNYFGIVENELQAGVFGIYSPWSVRGPPVQSDALPGFLKSFDQISSRGWLPTQRSGSTGIGYTLESLLEIPENNSPVGDFLGMELKTHRSDKLGTAGSKRMNLFLKEPTWTDGLSHRERIPTYGYVDDNGRVALYSTVTSTENSHGLRLAANSHDERVEILYRDKPVAFWTFDVLQTRLTEKLTETTFVGAKSRGKGKTEEFHYDSVLFCQQPSVESLIKLIKSRDSMVEMRMHIRDDGSARNHGTAFRVRQDQLPRLYMRTLMCRVPASPAMTR